MRHFLSSFIFFSGVSLLIVSCSPGPPAPAPRTVATPWLGSPAYDGPDTGNIRNVVTAGERAGDSKIRRNSIDQNLNAPKKERRARQGLATGWGEEVNSRMSYTRFVRASSKPAGGVSTIHYNDTEGARAMGATPGVRRTSLQRAANGLVSWGVKGRSRKLSTHYWKRGRIVVGKKGQKYSLVLKNLSRSRLEAVMSVDGLDVIDGKPASIKKRGYIVAPGKKLEVKGFRTSEDAVAAFRFSSVPHSYANLRHGNTRNVGVMGLAVFSEKGVDPWGNQYQEVQQRGGARAFSEAPILRAQN